MTRRDTSVSRFGHAASGPEISAQCTTLGSPHGPQCVCAEDARCWRSCRGAQFPEWFSCVLAWAQRTSVGSRMLVQAVTERRHRTVDALPLRLRKRALEDGAGTIQLQSNGRRMTTNPPAPPRSPEEWSSFRDQLGVFKSIGRIWQRSESSPTDCFRVGLSRPLVGTIRVRCALYPAARGERHRPRRTSSVVR